MKLGKYIANHYTYELNWYDWDALSIEVQNQKIGDKVEGYIIYDDKKICETINMSLKDYQEYCVKNFKAEVINNKLLFDDFRYFDNAIKWLQEKLIPLNVMSNLSQQSS